MTIHLSSKRKKDRFPWKELRSLLLTKSHRGKILVMYILNVTGQNCTIASLQELKIVEEVISCE